MALNIRHVSLDCSRKLCHRCEEKWCQHECHGTTSPNIDTIRKFAQEFEDDVRKFLNTRLATFEVEAGRIIQKIELHMIDVTEHNQQRPRVIVGQVFITINIGDGLTYRTEKAY